MEREGAGSTQRLGEPCKGFTGLPVPLPVPQFSLTQENYYRIHTSTLNKQHSPVCLSQQAQSTAVKMWVAVRRFKEELLSLPQFIYS